MTAIMGNPERLPDGAWEVPAIVLIDRDAAVPVSARTLAALASYALANPTEEVGKRHRDEALEDLRRAYVAAFEALGSGSREVDRG